MRVAASWLHLPTVMVSRATLSNRADFSGADEEIRARDPKWTSELYRRGSWGAGFRVK